jgi:putative holliday junction resolvase
MSRVLALDHGSARCGCAISDPSGTLATPLPAVERPDSKRGLAAIARMVEEHGVERVVVGLPLTLRGEEGEQAATARRFAERLNRRLTIPVELHDERLTTRLAERTGGSEVSLLRAGARPQTARLGGRRHPNADSRAAAHLLESYLARPSGGARR